ncbi:MAG: caspase family protein [Pseudomonadota bacterium]
MPATAAAVAKRHALLIGVATYDDPVSALLAPRFDVGALEKTLIEAWGFEPARITRLLDGDATHEGILSALRQLQITTEPGDFIFLYYAGHGTSAADPSAAAPLPHTSGALIPADYRREASGEEAAQSLIVGRRDLRPILEQLDAGGREVFFVVDACYSGNTVRGANLAATGRPPLPVRAADVAANHAPPPPSAAIDAEVYPYERVYYLSAAGEHEPAGEITEELLRWYPTFDGQPHGAFTDALLRAMRGLNPGTDANADGQLGYLELFMSVREFMSDRGYPQTPQFLPTLAQGGPALSQAVVLPAAPALATADQASDEKPQRVTVRLVNPLPADQTTLAELAGIEATDGAADLTLVRDTQLTRLLNAAGDVIGEVSDPESPFAWERIAGEVFVRSLRSRNPGGQVVAQFDDMALGASALRGDNLSLSVRATQLGYLLVFDLESNGGISVLYPVTPAEFGPVTPDALVRFRDLLVVPPFGVDQIVAVLLEQPLRGFKPYAGRTLDPGSAPLKQFRETLASRGDILSRTRVTLVTADSINRARGDETFRTAAEGDAG